MKPTRDEMFEPGSCPNIFSDLIAHFWINLKVVRSITWCSEHPRAYMQCIKSTSHNPYYRSELYAGRLFGGPAGAIAARFRIKKSRPVSWKISLLSHAKNGWLQKNPVEKKNTKCTHIRNHISCTNPAVVADIMTSKSPTRLSFSKEFFAVIIFPAAEKSHSDCAECP